MSVFEPTFRKVFGFDPSRYARHWSQARVSMKLAELTRAIIEARDKARRLQGSLAGLVSEADLRGWYRDLKIAIAELKCANEDFWLAYRLAKAEGLVPAAKAP